ncbi:hypothetical protein I5535_07275 [Rhodobacteraceae bacterium F11138]|nr:hypothetical protein [Rhodobacteraceae bacterium F11138]
MFGFLKKKSEIPLREILNGGNADYANFVKELFDGLDNATKAHVLVAYQNLIPIVGAMHNVAKQQGSAFSIDDFIIECAEKQAAARDEINTRRFAWFMWAAIVYRLVTMSNRDVGMRDTLAEVWCDIARCAPFLKALLPDNVVWKPDEKVWFDLMINDPTPGMVAWAINHGGPKVIWQSSAIKKLADEFGLFYFEGAETMGPISYIPPRPAPEE